MEPLDLDKAQELAKQVLAAAARTKVVLTPKAYQLWYSYFTGDNPDLVHDLDDRLASGKAITPELIEVIYKKYFNQPEGNQMMERVQRETQSIIKTVFDDLYRAYKDTTQFGGKLGQYVEQITSADRIVDLQQILKALVADTSAISESQRQLQEKLEAAHAQTEELKRRLKDTEQEAMHDPLTGLNNRKAFDQKLQELYENFKKEKSYFSAIFVDIDLFKKFNDTYGHRVGDLVLQTVGSILHKGLKGADFPARYGGEEFCILLPATTLDNAKIVAEQLRVLISVKKPRNPATGEVYDRVTASLGVARIRPEDTPTSVIERADDALYHAKKSGRNNVKTERDLAEELP